MALNVEIQGEAIDKIGDVDEFTFDAAAGADFNVFFQSSRRLILELLSAQGSTIARLFSEPTDTALFRYSTGRYSVVTGGPHQVRVSNPPPGDPGSGDTGPYRFFVYQIDRRPEQISVTATFNDTISGEDIDLPGDVDEFEFSASQGELFNVFFQAQNGTPDAGFQLHVISPSGNGLANVASRGVDSSLMQITGRFTITDGGIQKLRVFGDRSSIDRDRGPYRFFLYRVDPRPEWVPPLLQPGDSFVGEALELPGDLDEYTLAVSEATGANLILQFGEDRSAGLPLVQVLDSTGASLQAASLMDQDGFVQTQRLRLMQGSYRALVDGFGGSERGILHGSYRGWFYRFSFGPETRGDTIAIGDTVRGEALDPPGDEDVFRFHAMTRDHVDIALQGLGTSAASTTGGFEVSLFGPAGGTDYMGQVVSPLAAASLDDHRSLRLDIPKTGWYTLSVTAASTPERLSEAGSYHLGLVRFATSPETAGGTLVPGDSVTVELIDTSGDWDEYTITATPGEELGLLFSSAGATTFPSILAFDPTTRDSLAGTVGQFERFAGPFRVPANGQVAVGVFERPAAPARSCVEPTCGGLYPFTGPYRFRVVRVHRAPEMAPAEYTVGDTVRGEGLDPIGDLDEFTGSAAPGETLTPFWRLTANAVPAGQGIRLEIIDPASGDTLAGQGYFLSTAGSTFQSPGSFSVPASGNFIVRVRGSGTFGDDIGTAPYEFFVRRGP